MEQKKLDSSQIIGFLFLIGAFLWMFMFQPDFDEENKKQREAQNKHIRIANNMVDTVLRGSGIYGAIGATLKNTLVKLYQNEGKDPFAKDNADILLEAVGQQFLHQ